MIDDPLGFWHAEFEPRLARVVVEELVYPPSGSSRSTCDSLDIGRPPFLNGGLHNTTTLRVCNGRNWAKCRRRETRQKKTPPTPLQRWTATGPHKKPLPAKLGDAPDGVFDGHRGARKQSKAQKGNTRGALGNSKLRASRMKMSPNR